MGPHLSSDLQQETMFEAQLTPMVELSIRLVKLSLGVAHTCRLIIDCVSCCEY